MNAPIRHAVVVGVLLSGNLTAGDDAKAEMKTLEGTWVGVSGISDGKNWRRTRPRRSR
jgi:hypothetical protein